MAENSGSSGYSIGNMGKRPVLIAFLVIALTLLALFLRVWNLDGVPPGWRDDELINSLVISQKVLDGDWAVYYPDASGHEALYHVLSAATLALFGPGTAGIRWLPALLGTLTIPLTYLVAARMYGKKIGFLAAAALTVGFWSLMYSRVGIRHISLPVFMLAAFYVFLRAMDFDYENTVLDEDRNQESSSRKLPWFLAAGIFIGLGFYTYFASRGIPAILLAFLFYLLLFQRWRVKANWKGILLTFVAAIIIALPLIATLNRQPEAEARVSELAAPLSEALEGDLERLLDHTSQTLRMFLDTGDGEWLYNIPNRSVFSGIGALFFWTGVFVALWYMFKPIGRLVKGLLGREVTSPKTSYHLEAVSAFLILWWLAGISPAFVSVPAASFGHTIGAQSAAYILLALPLLPLEKLSTKLFTDRWKWTAGRWVLPGMAALILLASLAYRDLPDYFIEWPQRGMVRFLYRADIKELSTYVEEHPNLRDFGVSSLLAGPWDKLAFNIEFDGDQNVQPRWYNPERTLLTRTRDGAALNFAGYPVSQTPFQSYIEPAVIGSVGDFQISMVKDLDVSDDPICFQNGLCSTGASYADDQLELAFLVLRPIDLPSMPLISNPPPPGVNSGPRLLVFAQLLDDQGNLLNGDDGLWIDAASLRAGDQFVQRHHLSNPGNGAVIIYGLYDPMTQERLPTDSGQFQLEYRLSGSE